LAIVHQVVIGGGIDVQIVNVDILGDAVATAADVQQRRVVVCYEGQFARGPAFE